VLAFAEFKARAAEGVGLTCRVVILVPAFGPATMGPCVATVVVPLAFPLDGARRARILSGNIIGQPNSSDSATFRSSSSPELRSCLASRVWLLLDYPWGLLAFVAIAALYGLR
jgi:hypothetical protein